VFPLDVLPDGLARVAELLPLTPAVDLMRIGLLGVTADGTVVDFAESFGAAVQPVVVLAAWTAVGIWLVRRYFRWEPRR
jgi:ABC-2 type transport system permease protein